MGKIYIDEIDTIDRLITRSKDTNIIYLTEDTILNTKAVQKIANRLEQLEKENKELKNNCKKCIVRDRLSEYVENSIPKSVIRDKIEKLEKNRESFRSNEKNSKDLNEKIFWHSQFKEMVIAINVLKETIGGINGYNNKTNK
jgi:hypothetical protein